MQKQTLSCAWQFRQAGTDEWLPATVPGGVHTDLLALGKIPDPFVADNELKVMWVAETDWEYRRTFRVDASLLAEENVLLVCDGLDTIADIYLNGTYLGHAENMFRRWEWNVKGILREGENELRIQFGSPIRFISARQAQFPLQGGGDLLMYEQRSSTPIWNQRGRLELRSRLDPRTTLESDLDATYAPDPIGLAKLGIFGRTGAALIGNGSARFAWRLDHEWTVAGTLSSTLCSDTPSPP